ncbi:Blp family class II bacteriocin [Tissierella sp. MSJ-40]|uniref:Blp family class II bacteriocin n=1 Tax=Tissierella simiarum TaxID=2841534 RepID=A0ABS6E0N0_9FIRM|nr:Blp family class II bacteriocin [Tissierella simiarum]MBU5436456.1 Blp family class II bacteriocin [Tissierella simiarum]
MELALTNDFQEITMDEAILLDGGGKISTAVSTISGAISGAKTVGAMGSVAGPVGTIIGGAAGAIIGGGLSYSGTKILDALP